MRTARVLLSLLVPLSVAAWGQAGGGPEWLDDPDAAFARAAESGRPLLVVFR